MRMTRFAARFAPVLIAVVSLFTFTGCGGGGGGGGSRSASVRGIVKDSANGDEPVEGAQVTIGGATATTRTRDNSSADNPVGSFELSNPSTGADVATITFSGGGSQQVAFEPSITSGANPELELFVNIGQVRGRILLPNGQPAPNARVTASATGESREAGTNGTFLLQLIPVGDTEIFAVQGTATARKTVTVGSGLNNVGDIQLADDPNPNPPGRPRTIFGTITLQGVGNVSGVTVLLLRDGTQVESSFTDAEGKYSFFVPMGNYTVRALSTGFQDGTATANLTDAASPIQVDITLQP